MTDRDPFGHPPSHDLVCEPCDTAIWDGAPDPFRAIYPQEVQPLPQKPVDLSDETRA